jgi:ankyrin repeat protein
MNTFLTIVGIILVTIIFNYTIGYRITTRLFPGKFGLTMSIDLNYIKGIEYNLNKCGVNSIVFDLNISPIMLACYRKKYVSLEYLIQRGEDINYRDNMGRTPLFYVSNKGDIELVKMLLSGNPDVNIPMNGGLTPLMAAAYIGNMNIVKALIDAKADKYIKDNDGNTALTYAKENGNLEIINLVS